MDKDIAIKAGKKCDFILKSYAKIEKEKDKFIVNILKYNNEKYTLKPDVVVGADGVKSLSAKISNIKGSREILSSCQLEFVNVDIDDDFVHIFFNKNYSEHFFTWIIPLGKDRVRVGLLDKGDSYRKLMNFINNNKVAKELLSNATPVEFSSGALPIGYMDSVKNNLILVGDAACHVKPITGGGIYFSALAGKIAGKIITEYLNDNKNLVEYDKLWKDKFGKEIKEGLKFRKIFLGLSNKDFETIFRVIKDSEIIEYINEYGNMDWQVEILKNISIKLFKKDKFLFLKILKDIIF